MTPDDCRLPAERIRWTCDPALFDFETTDQLPDLEDAIGQKRALRSIEFGLGMEETGFNLYIAGETGTGRASTIRSILDRTNAPVQRQSLAEASVPAGSATQRHYHRLSEEFYFILEGSGVMEIDGDTRQVNPGDCILIPPTAWHTITAVKGLRFLCCCAPPYSHEDTYFE